MAGKVFHVSDEIHAAVRKWCDARSVSPKSWVESVVSQALRERVTEIKTVSDPVSDPVPRREPVTTEPVRKKMLPPVNGDEEHTDNGNGEQKPWERPPFWKSRPAEAKQ